MEIGSYIDYTKLGFTVTTRDVKKLCKEARINHFASVVVPPSFVYIAAKELMDTTVAVVTVVGFPFGNTKKEVKVFETIEALKDGASEIDMVMNIGALKEKSYDYVMEEISEVRDACKGRVLKVIVETSVLTSEELREATKICNLEFVNFIKTSTGFGSRGVSLEDIEIINAEKNEVLEVKASGGIKTTDEALKYISLGVTRIGTSNGLDIVKGDK